MGAIAIEVILGFVTLTGSLLAAGKQQQVIPTRPIVYHGQNVINLVLLGVAAVSSVWLIVDLTVWQLFPVIIALSLRFGVPTVISLLNSYAVSPRWRWASCSRTAC